MANEQKESVGYPTPGLKSKDGFRQKSQACVNEATLFLESSFRGGRSASPPPHEPPGLAHEIDDNIARGMSSDAAARAAHRKLGNATQIREEIYDMNTIRFLDTIWQDLRYGCRLLRRNPTFSIVAILTLALGTGANAAIFQLVNSVRLRTLPVERPQDLVSIGINTNDTGRTGRFMSRRPFFSEPLWQAIRAEPQGFSHIFAWGITSWNLAADGEYRPAQGIRRSSARP